MVMMMDRPMTLEVIVSYRYVSETVGSYAGTIGLYMGLGHVIGVDKIETKWFCREREAGTIELYTGLGHVIGVDEIEIKWFCREREMMTKCENRGVSGRTDRTNLSSPPFFNIDCPQSTTC